ncbi:Qat anti-phage system TatD family nuclease QatD [Lacrimispora celerecrescens]|uniref:TatD DNase family protein n=1 Tax=[Clostridium] celerecrescens 18A TaxID=1286362 RepID=A0A2M8Z6X5_9FIRM|nr:Qat anti-phage system TatD family nuclease QatD [Lacrimispora celerecrescens]PJJ29202.1 TatD DNase family protein [[Clostridium] celerecrescens 18A]
MLVDTHFHLDLMENMQSLIKQFRGVDVGIIAVGTTPLAYSRELEFVSGINNIRVGLGFHPQLVEQREYEIDLFLQELKKTRYVGEVGLDFNKDNIRSKKQQLYFFRKIAQTCAKQGEKVISIHSVNATNEVINILEEEGTFKNCICILHWFTGTAIQRKRAVENDAYFSINQKMAKTKSGQQTIRNIPADKILLETDAPFTGMISSVNNLQNELESIIQDISLIRRENMMQQIKCNSENIFD